MIPKKLQPYFKTTLQKSRDNFLIEGVLVCCDSSDFKVGVIGEIKHSIFSKMLLFPKEEQTVLEVCCQKCSKVISVFDSNCDGYGQNCGNQFSCIQTKPIDCPKCQNGSFSVGLKYEYPSKEELEELEIPDIENAFTWIWATLKCNKCGAKYRNFIDYETD